ncbi:MAG: benzoate-CoA ligase family protein [Alphaproteobacteria bacterium]|nr:benzoate-CoA ligase family protein [Alphaproteobacteria bacterium]
MARSRTAKKRAAASLKISGPKARPRPTTGYSKADHTVTPPHIEFPRLYNAAADLIDPNLAAGRGKRIAVIDDRGAYTYAALARHVNRCGNALAGLGLGMEQRAMMIMLDTIDFPGVFLGAMKLGAVPVSVNTLLTADDYAFMLRDSRARVLVVSAALVDKVKPALADQPWLTAVVIAGGEAPGHKSLSRLIAKASDRLNPAATTGDDVAFWLYSSGSTGAPKGAVHVHTSLVTTAELYARPTLGLTENDVVFSAAKLFFAYGLGNALTFPMRAGATAVLMAERPTPQSVCRILKQHRPTVFYGVPTLYASLLASNELPARGHHSLRACVSAGEALPEELGQRWSERTGVDIYDGIGSTEMLHIFLSNGPKALRYGTTGKAVAGYELKLVDDHGAPVKPGEVGELLVNGPSSAVVYWNNRIRTRGTFQGEWTRTGDKYLMSEDGFFTYGGRTDDMLKVGGIYVSPFEVEGALVTHPAVLEAAVIGVADDSRLIKPKAYIVLKSGQAATSGLDDELKQHVRDRLAPYKYPRWIEFVSDLPKTATGKIQRFKLRQREAERAKPA